MPEPNASTAPESPAPPVYFLSLTAENFRCFTEPVTLDLSDGQGRPAMWNVIIGENGAGKTTLLELIAATRVDQASSIHRATPFAESIFFAYQEQNQNWHSGLTVHVWQDETNNISRSRHHRLLRMTCGTEFNSFVLDEELARQIWCAGYGANRQRSKRPLSESLSDDPCATLLDDNAELINAEAWLFQADYAVKTAKGASKARAEKRLAQVVDLVCGILPEGGVTDIRFGLNEDTAVMTPRVEAKTPFGWVRLRDLSLGYQAALTWMVDLAARMLERYPDSPNPLAEPAIVLVDEIDLHLHPKWQRELITKLRTTFPKTQFIVTAHSPLIVQAAPDANIALLKRVGDHVEIENDVDHIRNWRADQILTSDLFGLESARPPHLDAAFREREAILTKPTLTEADWKRLDEINREIGETPEGETTGGIEAQNLVRRAAQLLRGK